MEVWKVEPAKGAFSTRMTDAPFSAAERAQAMPDRPAPMMIRSALVSVAASSVEPVSAVSVLLAQPPRAMEAPSMDAPMQKALRLRWVGVMVPPSRR